ncbi:hypothetical protein BDP67DRAFT_493696 [Colletotrichum lupini]|nr:hypothetical protein BDP67DRAFT_493696 [Colletotrichum lupini]
MPGDMTARFENADAENEEELASCMLGVGFFVDRMATSRSFESLSQAEKWDAVDHLFWDWSPEQGMGGNQAMRDTADALPLLVRLAETAKTTEELKEADIIQACDRVTDRIMLYILSYAMTTRRLWLWLRSWMTRMMFGVRSQE